MFSMLQTLCSHRNSAASGTVTTHPMGVDLPIRLCSQKHSGLEQATHRPRFASPSRESSWFYTNKRFECHLLAEGYQELRAMYTVGLWRALRTENDKTCGSTAPPEPDQPSRHHSERDGTTLKWNIPAPLKHIQNHADFKHRTKQKGWWWLVALSLYSVAWWQTTLTSIWPVWAHLTFQPEA